MELEQIATEISESTTISYPDVLACLKAMEIQISKYVLQGSAVKLGYLGSFIPQLKAQSQESADLVDANTIKRYGCRFYPSIDFKRNIERTKFQMTDLEVKGKIS